MSAYQPGDRVIDAANGRRGEVVEDSITTECPGFIPVRWDNLDRTLAHPSILKHEDAQEAMTYTFPLAPCREHTFQWEDGQHDTCYRCGANSPETKEDRDALAKEHATASTTETLEKETIMPIIANTADKATTENIGRTEAQMLANLIHYVSGDDINPRELGNEVFTSRGMETIDRIFRELRALPANLEAEYRASEEAEDQA